MRQFLAALLLLAGFASGVQADVAVPPLKARVTDLTGTLTAQQQGELEAKIAAYETRRGSQIAVLLLPTTKPEEIEQYSIRVAEAWKIGRKGVDDGLILVVAKDDRRLRIEVGYGLEGVIPDAAASRVINEYITPRFRNGDFYGGVRDGVDQLIRLAEGEKLPPPAQAATSARSSLDDWPHFLFIGIVFVAFMTTSRPAAAQGDPKKGEQVYAAQKCQICHSIAGKGGKANPLDGVGGKLSAADIKQWITNPKEMATTAKSEKKPPMPDRYSKLPAEDVDALVAYVQTLK